MYNFCLSFSLAFRLKKMLLSESSLMSFDKDFMFSEIFSSRWHLTKHWRTFFFFPLCPSKGISCLCQKTLNDTIEQCSSYILVIILWPRVFLLGRFRSIIYTWHFEASNPLHKFSFLPMSRKRKNLCKVFSSQSQEFFRQVINFDPFGDHAIHWENMVSVTLITIAPIFPLESRNQGLNDVKLLSKCSHSC